MTNFSRLLTSAPINRQSAMHLSRAGEHYAPRMKPTRLSEAEGAFPFIAPPAELLKGANGGFIDLTGRQWGRMTVLGLLDFERAGLPVPKDGRLAPWVVRCACGRYETRRAKVIKAARPEDGRCCECGYLAARIQGRRPR